MLSVLGLVVILSNGPMIGQQADSGAFVVRLGTDTVSIERYTRRGNRIEAIAAGRTPRTAVARLTLTLGADGSVSALGVARGMQPPEERAVTQSGVIPLAGGFWLPWELALMRAHAAGRDSTVVTILAGGNPRPTTFKRTAPGRFTFLSQFDQVVHARLDPQGRLLALEIEGGGSTVERVRSLDVEGMVQRFAARDSAGTGLGPLSPRDTVSTEVRGARITVAYGRPSLRGRALDVLVPPGQVWRAGSNDASTLTTDRPLQFDSFTLASGTYSFFVQADPGRWVLILNKQTGMSGLERDPAQDVARIPLQTRTDAPATDKFTVEVVSREENGALMLKWGRIEATALFRIGSSASH